MTRQALVIAQQVVKRHAQLHFATVKKAATVKRHDELKRFDEMRRDPQERFALAQVHTYQAKIKHLQIAQAAVNQARRSGSCAAAEIVLFKQRDPETAHGSITGDAG